MTCSVTFLSPVCHCFLLTHCAPVKLLCWVYLERQGTFLPWPKAHASYCLWNVLLVLTLNTLNHLWFRWGITSFTLCGFLSAVIITLCANHCHNTYYITLGFLVSPLTVSPWTGDLILIIESLTTSIVSSIWNVHNNYFICKQISKKIANMISGKHL